MKAAISYRRQSCRNSNLSSRAITRQRAAQAGSLKNSIKRRVTCQSALPQMVDMAERFPRVRIILDHLARPVLEDGPRYTTADSLLALARYPNVYLKPTCVYRKPHPL